jgi:hypothetical protein
MPWWAWFIAGWWVAVLQIGLAWGLWARIKGRR